MAGERGELVAPHVPVLRPAVHQQQGRAAAGRGDMEAQPARLDEPVLNAVDVSCNSRPTFDFISANVLFILPP
jgi:hypothetical protein